MKIKSKKKNGRVQLAGLDGTVLIGGDAHYWPGPACPGHRAFVAFAAEFRPDAVILNGDVIDGASISRHAPIGWETNPTVQEELETAQKRLGEIASVTNPDTPLIWTLGNHDARFETRLATVAKEYADVKGIHLKDHFPDWEPAWSVEIGGEHGVIIKHRWKGGVNAAANNTLWGGRSIVTGHLHRLGLRGFSDYNGTRWAVEGGMLGDPDGRQFTYLEDIPRDWQRGFTLLTFDHGRLLMPELIDVHKNGSFTFRGEIWRL